MTVKVEDDIKGSDGRGREKKVRAVSIDGRALYETLLPEAGDREASIVDCCCAAPSPSEVSYRGRRNVGAWITRWARGRDRV